MYLLPYITIERAPSFLVLSLTASLFFGKKEMPVHIVVGWTGRSQEEHAVHERFWLFLSGLSIFFCSLVLSNLPSWWQVMAKLLVVFCGQLWALATASCYWFLTPWPLLQAEGMLQCKHLCATQHSSLHLLWMLEVSTPPHPMCLQEPSWHLYMVCAPSCISLCCSNISTSTLDTVEICLDLSLLPFTVCYFWIFIWSLLYYWNIPQCYNLVKQLFCLRGHQWA